MTSLAPFQMQNVNNQLPNSSTKHTKKVDLAIKLIESQDKDDFEK